MIQAAIFDWSLLICFDSKVTKTEKYNTLISRSLRSYKWRQRDRVVKTGLDIGGRGFDQVSFWPLAGVVLVSPEFNSSAK